MRERQWAPVTVLVAWFALCALVYSVRGRMASIWEALALLVGVLIAVGVAIYVRRTLSATSRD